MPTGLRGGVTYATDLFDRLTVEDITRRLLHVLEAVTTDPQAPVAQIEILDAAERQQLLTEWNDTRREVPQATLPELFQAQVARPPQATAVVFEDTLCRMRSSTGGRTGWPVNWSRQGAGPEKRVALAMPRSAEVIVALLAISKGRRRLSSC